MKASVVRGVVPAFILAVVLAVVWGSLVQTHYNLSALASMGADVASVRWQTMGRDLFSGFFPTYGGYVVLPALLVAFVVAALIARRAPAAARIPLFALAGGLAIFLANPLVNQLAPVALLVGATRDWGCTFWMSMGGVAAGLLFALLVPPAPRRPAHAHDTAHARPVAG
ncbi:hypothetical protein [Coralloluteibacterium thermophilus]|uniref:DUF1772 domain-containing protein n=1 Tax=Coralloluteibacterium thermophilum TaxID=2707049 RepID=A0ABV9NR01_9GAMM